LETLKGKLREIFQTILGATYGRSNPTITKSGDRIFKGFFEFTGDQSWKGGFYAYDVDKATGSIIDANPLTPPPAIDPVWDAGDKLTIDGRGTIWTWKDDLLNPSRQSFDINTPTLYPLVYPNPRTEDIDGDTAMDDDDAKTIIGYTLDPNFDDRPGGGIHPPPYHKGQRPVISNQGWKLGDIYHSTPVFVAAPPFGFAENDYITFYQHYRNRTQMVYVGANDGMLHGIKNTKGTDSTDGRENIAIIPKNLLGKVRNLRSTHDYYVDATPKAYDVFFSGLTTDNWKKWRTVIITGQRDGGPYYFAVDVTNPNGYGFGPEYPRILWEWTDPNMGNSWAKPDVGKINDGGTIKYVAFITGGYSTTNNKGNSFYIVDIETGTTLKSWVNLGVVDNKIPSSPTAFDANGDGLVDYIYFGDTKGTLWKVNVTSPNTVDWSCNTLFTPTLLAQRKPIFYSPTAVKNNEGKILVFFGTGEEMNLLTVTDNYFWEVWDDNGTGRIIGPNWPKVLTGEKVLSSPVVANYVVYFTSWLYTAGSEYCGAGEGRLYGFKISNAGIDGGIAGLVTLDNNGNPNPVTDYVVIGPGIPTSPVVTNGNIYVSSNVDAKNIIRIRFLGWPAARTKSWREVF
jgi:hypothetical protein